MNNTNDINLDNQTLQTNNTLDNNNFGDLNQFDFANQDIDVSNIEIIDTSKGGVIGDDVLNLSAISLICQNCGFKYEGRKLVDKCPRCGSRDLVDG